MTIDERDNLLYLIESIIVKLSKVANSDIANLNIRKLLQSLKYDVIKFWDILPSVKMDDNTPKTMDIIGHLEGLLAALRASNMNRILAYQEQITRYSSIVRKNHMYPFGRVSRSALEVIKAEGNNLDISGIHNRLQIALKECSLLRSQILSDRKANNELKEKFNDQLEALSVEKAKVEQLQIEQKQEKQTLSTLEEGVIKQSDELEIELKFLQIEKEKAISFYDKLEKKEEELNNLGRELTEGIGAYKNNIKNIESEESKRKSEYEQLNKKIKTQNEELQKLIHENKKLNISLETSAQELERRENYLDDLIGKEVGKSLFLTFDKRKKELSKPVLIWAFIVGFITVALAIFIYCIFLNVDFKTANWGLYLVNGIRLLPVIIVLFFCIRQYQRERNFQEEYAFKSAVALTIDAYSKQIGDQDKRDDMIIESVAKVYDSPIEKHLSKENIKNKSMLKGIEVVKEAVVETAKDVAEVAKKIK